MPDFQTNPALGWLLSFYHSHFPSAGEKWPCSFSLGLPVAMTIPAVTTASISLGHLVARLQRQRGFRSASGGGRKGKAGKNETVEEEEGVQKCLWKVPGSCR